MEADLKRYLSALKKRSWIIVIIALAAGISAGFYTLKFKPDYYAATTKIIVNKTISVIGGQQMDESSLGTSLRLIDTYKEIILTPAIMDKVEQRYPELGLKSKDLIGMIKVDSLNSTQVMTITAYDTSYVRAARTANAVAEVFRMEIPKIMKIDNVTMLTQAKEDEPTRPFGRNLNQNVSVSFFVALILAAGLIILLEYGDQSFKSEEEVLQVLGVPSIAIPKMRKRDFRAKKKRANAQMLQAGEQTL